MPETDLRGAGSTNRSGTQTEHPVGDRSRKASVPRWVHLLILFADRHRYLLLSLALVALMTSQTLNQEWSTDFWEHSAVVRELATHLLHPRHPLLLVGSPHPYYSPYMLAVAALSQLLDL